MEMQNKLLRTGEGVVLTKDRAPAFEFVRFEALDAPRHMPSGSVVCIDNILGDDDVVMPNVVVRGWCSWLNLKRSVSFVSMSRLAS